jgi:hypothetical protein
VAGGIERKLPVSKTQHAATAGDGTVVGTTIVSAAVIDLFEHVVVGIDTARGLDLLESCRPQHLTNLASIMRHHQIQENLALCGVAGAAIVINSLGLSSATILINTLGLSSRPILEQYSRPDWGLEVPRMTQMSLLGLLAKKERLTIQHACSPKTAR